MKTERRMIQMPVAKIEVRKDDDGKQTIKGYAAVFYDGSEGTEYKLWRGMKERIAPGAFDDVLAADVRALFNHDVNFVLGRTAAGTAKIFVDSRGLGFEITPPASRADVIEALERGDVTGSSFTFSVYGEGGKTSYTEEGEYEIRTIEKVSALLDVSPVTFPAYEGTDAYIRSMNITEKQDIEEERKRQRQPSKQARATAQAQDMAIRMATRK